MYCNHCNKNMSNNFKFCPVCGTHLTSPKSTNTTRKVVIGIVIPIVIILIVLGMNLYALSNLQFKANAVNNFDAFDFSMDADFVVCNPTFFPASFNKLEVDILYKTTNFGTFTILGQNIPPMTPTIVEGQIKINGEFVLQQLLGSMGSSFGGQGMNFDPNQMKFIGKLDAPIFGVIPFSISHTFSADEFSEMMQGNSGQWSC